MCRFSTLFQQVRDIGACGIQRHIAGCNHRNLIVGLFNSPMSRICQRQLRILQADSRHHQQKHRPHRSAKESISLTRPPAEMSEVTTPNYYDTNDNKRSLHHPARTGAIRNILLSPPRQTHKPDNVRLPHRQR